MIAGKVPLTGVLPTQRILADANFDFILVIYF